MYPTKSTALEITSGLAKMHNSEPDNDDDLPGGDMHKSCF
jgi:hypothetical protein